MADFGMADISDAPKLILLLLFKYGSEICGILFGTSI
jgi:hypothetical protein